MQIKTFDALVLGSGASGLAAAVRLRAEGVANVAVLTEGLNCGTSINTGSDKQTYYKLGLCGATQDSPKSLAETYLASGGADGDLALVEAATSTRAFFHLVNLGVPFPRDAFGQYAGYKTDHDPAKRATSLGPHTSRAMCVALIRELKRCGTTVYENRVAVKLLAVDIPQHNANAAAPRKKIVGLLAVSTETGELEVYRSERVVFAVGGPGGLYRTSVYPEIQTGAIGLALEIGAVASGLPESQFGLASFTDVSQRVVKNEEASQSNVDFLPAKEFRWNVSGAYMQVVPKFVSTAPDGVSEPREFLRPYFSDVGDMFERIFLKGYQWPFDVRKAIGGSSLVDLCVFYETATLGRRVFLDYRENPQCFDFKRLPNEAFDYLQKSDALQKTPFERLMRMNPGAVELYRSVGVDLEKEPLEIAVCAQHNNGGLAVDVWFRSINVEGLFPIGEVAGTHGVARPGGSALNAGQVGAFRVAERIARDLNVAAQSRKKTTFSETEQMMEFARFQELAAKEIKKLRRLVVRARQEKIDWKTERDELRKRTSESAGIFRSEPKLRGARRDAVEQLNRLYYRTFCVESKRTPTNADAECKQAFTNGVVQSKRMPTNAEQDFVAADAPFFFGEDATETLRNVQLSFAQNLYLDAIYENVAAGVGSRGSAATLSDDGITISEKFPNDWKMRPENETFRKKIFFSFYAPELDGETTRFATRSFWRDAKPIPQPDEWFENVWRDFREGTIFDDARSDEGE